MSRATPITTTQLGVRFVEAIAHKDIDAFTGLLSAEVDFHALTPAGSWEGHTPESVADIVLGTWFRTERVIKQVLRFNVDESLPVGHAGYRFDVTRPDGQFVVEQQALYRHTHDQIISLSICCTGFLPTRRRSSASPQQG